MCQSSLENEAIQGEMRHCILSVPGSSCAWCPLCPRLSSSNTFLPPYLFCWSQCDLGLVVQTHGKSWLSTLVDSHLLPPFHIGNITGFKASEDFRIHQFKLLAENSWKFVAQRRRKTHPRLHPRVQSDLNPTCYPLSFHLFFFFFGFVDIFCCEW